MQSHFLRFKEVTELLGVSRSTIYSWLATSNFPQPKRLSPRVLVWTREDIDTWTLRLNEGDSRTEQGGME